MFDSDPKDNLLKAEPSSAASIPQPLDGPVHILVDLDPRLSTAPKPDSAQLHVIGLGDLIPNFERITDSNSIQHSVSAAPQIACEKEVVLRYEIKSYAQGEGGDLKYVADLLGRIKTAESISPSSAIDDELMEAVASIMARSARHRELRMDGLAAVSEMLSDPDLAKLIAEYGDFFVAGIGQDLLMGLPELERFEGAALLIERFQLGSEAPQQLKRQIEQKSDPIYALIDNIAQLLEQSALILERKLDPRIDRKLIEWDEVSVRGAAAGTLRSISDRIKPHLLQRRRNKRSFKILVAATLSLLGALTAHSMGMDLKFEAIIAVLIFGAGFRIATYDHR